MHLRRHLWLATLGLLLSACAPTPLAGPESATSTSPAAPGLLAGTIAGLDPGASASLRLERLAQTQPSDQDQVVLRFSVTNGRWQQTGLALSPGRYRLIPEAEGYVSIRGTITFHVPEAGIIWHYTHLNFEFLHPEDAPIRLGVPLCPELPAHGGTFVLPEGTPTPTPLPLPAPPPLIPPGPETWPPGTCYAGHFGNGWVLPAGLQGQISGLPAGQVATITLYALPPAPDENYLVGCAPPRDGSWTYPPEVTSLAEQPVIAPDWPLTATLTVSNGPWGLVDPSLAGGKYLVMAQAPRPVAEPPGYEVVIFGGKIPGMPDGVDFAFRPKETPRRN